MCASSISLDSLVVRSPIGAQRRKSLNIYMLLLKHATCGEERPAIAGVIPQADPCILQDGKVGRCFTLVLLSFYSLWASIFHETQPSKVSFPCPMPTLRPATSRSSCIMMTKRHGSSQLSFC